ncbi:MAG TPA: MAPEG family protein [Polyangia bacterium]|nr:MAPEG family protein [Polyangia bacterium]
MRQEAIFAPVSALAIWTLGVLTMTGLRRVFAVRARRVPAKAFRYGESADVPDELRVWNRNFVNLLETPLLFYVVSIAFYVTRNVSPAVVRLAWVYVALRVLHSIVHLTVNRIVVRFSVFAASITVLAWQWLSFAHRFL